MPEAGEEQHGRRIRRRTRRVEDPETFGVAVELDVADEDVDARDQLERVREGSSRACELETVGGRDRVGHGGDDRWVVVDDADADWFGHPPLSVASVGPPRTCSHRVLAPRPRGGSTRSEDLRDRCPIAAMR